VLYYRRVLPLAARAAIRSASANKLRSARVEGMGSGEGGGSDAWRGGRGARHQLGVDQLAVDQLGVDQLESSASTTGASESRSRFTVATYLQNAPSRVT
jgi:hypothetical protein